jgi:hypothetical protein
MALNVDLKCESIRRRGNLTDDVIERTNRDVLGTHGGRLGHRLADVREDM